VRAFREAHYLTLELKASRPISLLPLIQHAAARDINKPIKASKGVEVSWPEFPSGILLPNVLVLLSDHQYGTPAVREICSVIVVVRKKRLDYNASKLQQNFETSIWLMVWFQKT
jgi:hypothetical protein